MWAKFDDGYDENPKCRAAGKDGRALDQAGIRYCARHLTDGLISDHALPVMAALAEVPLRKTLTRLVDVGRWHGPGHDCDRCPPCPVDHHVVHDYLDYNPDAERERAKRLARAEAGRKGGQRSRPPGSKQASNGEANPKQTLKQMPSNGEANPNPVPVPVPVPPVDTSDDNSRRPTGSPDDDPAEQAPPTTAEIVERALATLVDRDLTARQNVPGREPIHDPAAWRRRAIAERRGRGTPAALTELAQLNPAAGPAALADLLEPPGTPGAPPRRPDPPAGQQAAERLRQAEGMAQTAERHEITEATPDQAAAAIAAARDALPRTRSNP